MNDYLMNYDYWIVFYTSQKSSNTHNLIYKNAFFLWGKAMIMRILMMSFICKMIDDKSLLIFA